jgi:hypothetical protein
VTSGRRRAGRVGVATIAATLRTASGRAGVWAGPWAAVGAVRIKRLHAGRFGARAELATGWLIEGR